MIWMPIYRAGRCEDCARSRGDMKFGTINFSDDAGKHSDGKGGECTERTFAVKSVGVGGVYTNIVVCYFCKRELVAYENGLAPEPFFYVTQTQGPFRREVWDLTETALYAHVRTRTGDIDAAEAMLEELRER